MAQQRHQAIIDELMNEIQELREDNDRLKAENSRLGGMRGVGPAIQERQCLGCHRRLPDGPAYFPGFLQEFSTDLATELYRHWCIYCRGEGQ